MRRRNVLRAIPVWVFSICGLASLGTKKASAQQSLIPKSDTLEVSDTPHLRSLTWEVQYTCGGCGVLQIVTRGVFPTVCPCGTVLPVADLADFAYRTDLYRWVVGLI